MPPDPLPVHALVHIINICTKGSQYKHIPKGAFLSETAPENDLGLLEFQNSLGKNAPDPLACCMPAVRACTFPFQGRCHPNSSGPVGLYLHPVNAFHWVA